MIKNLFLIFLLTTCNCTFSQNKTSVDLKYLTAIIYLKTNPQINNEIKKFEEKWLTKQTNPECISDFNLSESIMYLPIPEINLTSLESNLKISHKLHREQYYFDSEKVENLKNIIPNRKSKLYLLFSKPIDNYLIAEFLINSTNNELDLIIHKKGPVMHLVFIFDETGAVKKALISYSYYN